MGYERRPAPVPSQARRGWNRLGLLFVSTPRAVTSRDSVRTRSSVCGRWLRPADAEPIVLHRGEIVQANPLEFNPKADWLPHHRPHRARLWPLGREYPSVIRRHAGGVYGLGFAPDGSWIASSSADGTVRIWPLVGDPRPQGSIRHETDTVMIDLAVSPDGQRLIVGEGEGNTTLLSLDGTPPTVLDGFEHQSWGVAFSHDGRLAAAAGGGFVPADRVIRIWDVASGEEVRVLEVGEPPSIEKVRFLPDRRSYLGSRIGAPALGHRTRRTNSSLRRDYLRFRRRHRRPAGAYG